VRFNRPVSNLILNRESAKIVIKGTQLSMDHASSSTPLPKPILVVQYGLAEYVLLALRDGILTLIMCVPLSAIFALPGMTIAEFVSPATMDILFRMDHVSSMLTPALSLIATYSATCGLDRPVSNALLELSSTLMESAPPSVLNATVLTRPVETVSLALLDTT
jgi:hypothetical protein